MLTISTGDQRLELEYQGNAVAVTLAPANLTDQLHSLEWARRQGLWSLDPDTDSAGRMVTAISFDRLTLLRRIKAWEGLVDGQGDPLPCTEDMKVLVFGQQPGLIALIEERLSAAEEAERKNSGPSQTG